MFYRVNSAFTEEEIFELKQVIGEFKRISRDQVYRYVKGSYESSTDVVSNKRLEVATSLLEKINLAVKEDTV